MHIAIVEDDAATRATTTALLTAYQTEHNQELTWTNFESAEALLFALPDTAFDFLLLDIRLTGRDGMTLAKSIRARDANIAIAFLSNYEQYVFDGYDVDALAYIMKPLTAPKLAGLLSKAESRMQPEASCSVFTATCSACTSMTFATWKPVATTSPCTPN